MFNNPFAKAYSIKQSEQKSHSVSQFLGVYNNNFSLFNGNQVSLNNFLNDFIVSAPLFTAIKLITDNFSPINPIIFDQKKLEFIPSHPLTDLINKKPNPFETPFLFKDSISSFYSITGNSYINVVGKVGDLKGNRPPLELQTLSPADVTPESIDNTNFPQRFTYRTGSINIEYNYDIVSQKYLSIDGNELLQLKTFNPRHNSTNFLGLSTLQPIQLEIQQYLQASIHNHAVLKNQGRPSALVTVDNNDGNMLGDEQISEIQERLKEVKGAENAGKINFMPFAIKWQAISESIKDMDFETLKTMTEQAIYKAFKIPLSFATEESSTMNNKEIARLDLYDNAIIPLTKRVYNFLDEKLLPRYPNSENLKLIVDESAIPVLARRKIVETKEKKELGALSINEIRAEIGREGIGAEGDIIYQPTNLVPIGTDEFVDDNRKKPAKRKNEDIAYEKALFRKVLIDQGYGKDYIDKCLKEHCE